MNFRKLLGTSILLIVSFANLAKAQSLEEFILTNLTYPSEARLEGIEGRVILSLELTDEGFPNTIFLIESASDVLTNESLKVTNRLVKNWDPSFLENDSMEDDPYLVFNYWLDKGNQEFSIIKTKVERMITKQNYKKALDLINQEIELNPYEIQAYVLRAEIYRQTGLTEDFQRDYMTSKQLGKKILLNAEIIAF